MLADVFRPSSKNAWLFNHYIPGAYERKSSLIQNYETSWWFDMEYTNQRENVPNITQNAGYLDGHVEATRNWAEINPYGYYCNKTNDVVNTYIPAEWHN